MPTLVKIATALILCTASVYAADWPQWRGSKQNGISPDNLPLSPLKAKSGPKVLWKANVGPGCSSFAVVGNRVYTMGNGEKDAEDQDIGSIYCLNASTGAVVWKHTFPSKLDPRAFEGGQCATPTVDGDRVYALSRQGLFFCLNKDTGAVVWSKNFLTDFGTKLLDWSYTGSALVLGNAVFMDVGGKGASSVAFDKKTGDVIWQAGDDRQSYSTPYAFMQKGKQSVAFYNEYGLVVRNAADGEETLRFAWKNDGEVNAAIPIAADGKIFISCAYSLGPVLLPLDSAEPKPIWQNRKLRNKINSSVLWKGHLYGFDESALTCMVFATGEVKWQQDGLGMASLIISGDGKLIIQAEKGDLVIAEATPKAYKELARVEAAVPNRSWVAPVLANGKLFCGDNSGNITVLNVSLPKASK